MTGVLVKVKGDGKALGAAATKAFGATKVSVTPILRLPARTARPGLAATQGSTWLRVSGAGPSENPWDRAHEMLAPGSPFAAAGRAAIEAIEPDVEQQWNWKPPAPKGQGFASANNQAEFCAFDDQDGVGGKAKGPGPAWNLGDAFSQLKTARDRVGVKQEKILIAHLDTGYDPAHSALPAQLRMDLQRNFVDAAFPNDAQDRVPPGMEFVRNRGHGTGTLSLLSGKKLDGTSPGFPGFKDYLGGAPQAQIIPVRIADWVVRFTTGTIVQGIDYAVQQGAHVLSMSMGGLTSQALVDAVNLAYEQGLVLVTAAGNNVAWRPSPKTVVFPARYRRVIAACGVMADGRAYADLASGTMQGNYGPPEKMATALGAYTPNVPWAQIACGKIVDMDGAGTSAATPQIAAAAALWLAEHWDEVQAYSECWMRVEAVRCALFASAAKTTARMSKYEVFEKIGQGVMQAEAARKTKSPKQEQLQKLPPAQPSWPWIDLIFGGGVSLAARGGDPRRAMFALELTQMAQRVPQVEAAIDGPEGDPERSSAAARNRYLEAALDAGNPSKPLRAFLENLLSRPQSAAAPSASPPIRRKIVKPDPPARRLRVYALDPSIAKRLDTVAINETTIETPWDDRPTTREPLMPGPVGEYLEVVDVDPASGKVYEPVDLNDKILLAQNGLPPSEGNPQFHQQMVYAVAMKTISHFEEALGRRALWAPHYAADDDQGDLKSHDTPRLRIYPHALRMSNAYYSPEKKALLFGYFPAGSGEGYATTPGSMVFSCLSSDIISHEMSHALLDGLHRRFEEASNPDVPAFHEAFADIVAIFQHFTIPVLVSFAIGRARGKLSAAELLSGLAFQFGEGTGIGGALRDYGDKSTVASKRYEDTFEPHERGEILVLAVYDAFLAIVARRTADLIRIATGGSGVLPDGALHPDLVERLTQETCTSARHVLRICIRALDYCPSVDITYGEYLRALITADFDLVQDDEFGYRTAFIEAFRERGIPVRDVRTLATESLTWNAPENDRPEWLTTDRNEELKVIFERFVSGYDKALDRSQLYDFNEKNRWVLWRALSAAFTNDSVLCREFGFLPGVPRYKQDRTELPPRPGSVTTFEVYSVRPARRITPDGSLRTDVIAVVHQRRVVPRDDKDPSKGSFWFRGGATLVLDLNHGRPRIRYIVIKKSDSERRLDIQKSMESGSYLSPLRALYFGAAKSEPFAMMHAGHRGGIDG